MVRKKFTRIHTEIEVNRIASNKIKYIWYKIGQYLIKYKDKWERAVK
jgi:hypothetical protein